jgi:hypothetical protein
MWVVLLLPVLAGCGGSAPEPQGDGTTATVEPTLTTTGSGALLAGTATQQAIDTALAPPEASATTADVTATEVVAAPIATSIPSPAPTSPITRLPPRLQGIARAPGPGLPVPGGEPLQLPFPPDEGRSLTVRGGPPDNFEGEFFDVGERLALAGRGFEPYAPVEVGLYALRGPLTEESLSQPEHLALERLTTWTAQADAEGNVERDLSFPAGIQPGVFALFACRTGSCQPTTTGGRTSLPPAAGTWLVLRSPNGDSPWDQRISRVHVDVEGDTLNVRARPGVNGAIRAKLPEGTEVVIQDGPVLVDPRNPWYLISAYDGQVQGWVNGRYLVP